MSASEGEQPVIYRVPSALLVPALGAAGYALAHAYEASYLAYFGVPEGLVRVSVNTAIVAFGSLLSVVLPAFYMTYFLTGALRGRDGKFTGRPEVLAALLLFMFFVFDALMRPSWPVRAGYIVAVVVLVPVFGAVVSLLRERAKNRVGSSAQPLNPADWLIPLIGLDALVVLGVIGAGHAMAGLVGTVHARSQTEFLTLDDPSGFVALRVYDGMVVAAALDRANHTVGPGVRLPNPDKIMAKREVLGPLKPLR